MHGFLLAAQAPGIEGQTFNLGTGSEARIADLAQQIIQLTGRSIQIEVEAERLRPDKSEVQRLLSDNHRARERLGWEPAISLDQGLRETFRWIQAHLDLYQPGIYQF